MLNIHPIKTAYLIQDINHLETCLSQCKNDTYLSVKMTSIIQKHEIVMKVACFGLSKLFISFWKIAYLSVRKLPKS